MTKRPKSPREPLAYGYCRVSTDDQVRGESLEAQRARITAICAAEGLTLADVFIEEGVSGSIPLAERPQGARLLAAAKRGDAIVALKLDRVFRNTADALASAGSLDKRGVRLYVHDLRGFISGDAAGKLHFTMLAGFADFERARIGERIRDARRSLRAKGIYSGGDAPFGFEKVADETGATTRHDKPRHNLVPIPAIHTVARDLLAKGYSSRLAAGHFAQHGYDVSHVAVNGLFHWLRDAEPVT